MDNKIINIETTRSKSSRITITPNRVTIKISHIAAGIFSNEKWNSIAEKLSNIFVEKSHRGNIGFFPFGFHIMLSTESRSHSIKVSYYENLDKLIYNEL